MQFQRDVVKSKHVHKISNQRTSGGTRQKTQNCVLLGQNTGDNLVDPTGTSFYGPYSALNLKSLITNGAEAPGTGDTIVNMLGGSIAIGENALSKNKNGLCNVAIGKNAAAKLTISNSQPFWKGGLPGAAWGDVAIGAFAMAESIPVENGGYSHAAATGRFHGTSENVAIGFASLYKGQGSQNVSIGSQAMVNATTGYQNVVVGSQSGKSISTGDGNIAIGSESAKVITTGKENVVIGNEAAKTILKSGSNNVVIGNGANPSTDIAANQIVIGDTATGLGDNIAVIGNSDVLKVYAAQDGDADLHAYSTINGSDRRLKKNIKQLPMGVNFIKDLKPVQYKYKKTKGDGKLQMGLIAQEVVETMKTHNIPHDEYGVVQYDDEKDQYGLNYPNLIAPLISAVQELTARLECLEQKLNVTPPPPIEDTASPDEYPGDEEVVAEEVVAEEVVAEEGEVAEEVVAEEGEVAEEEAAPEEGEAAAEEEGEVAGEAAPEEGEVAEEEGEVAGEEGEVAEEEGEAVPEEEEAVPEEGGEVAEEGGEVAEEGGEVAEEGEAAPEEADPEETA